MNKYNLLICDKTKRFSVIDCSYKFKFTGLRVEECESIVGIGDEYTALGYSEVDAEKLYPEYFLTFHEGANVFTTRKLTHINMDTLRNGDTILVGANTLVYNGKYVVSENSLSPYGGVVRIGANLYLGFPDAREELDGFIQEYQFETFEVSQLLQGEIRISLVKKCKDISDALRCDTNVEEFLTELPSTVKFILNHNTKIFGCNVEWIKGTEISYHGSVDTIPETSFKAEPGNNAQFVKGCLPIMVAVLKDSQVVKVSPKDFPARKDVVDYRLFTRDQEDEAEECLKEFEERLKTKFLFSSRNPTGVLLETHIETLIGDIKKKNSLIQHIDESWAEVYRGSNSDIISLLENVKRIQIEALATVAELRKAQ